MLLKKFCRFVIPSIISMWIFALYTMVDGIFVARGVGEYALAAVNLSMPYNGDRDVDTDGDIPGRR